jgi:hypothetical protein
VFNFRGVQSAFPTLDGVAGRRRKSRRGAMGTVIEVCPYSLIRRGCLVRSGGVERMY